MKMAEAKRLMDKKKERGYMVDFEVIKGSFLCSNHFPDYHSGEKLIETEEEAWSLAKKFADAMRGKVVNVYVINSDFTPVREYKERMLLRRVV